MNPARIQALAAPPTAAPPIAAPPIVALAGLLACADGFVYLHGSPLALPPKEQAALHLLISEWPKVVSKERFAQQVWPGQDMSDESLARCMAQLRKPLSRCTRLRIQSVYQRGYRLVVPQEAALPALPTLVPGAVHARLLHDALAQPAHVAVLTHARQLVQQRTPASLQHAEQLLTELIAQAPGYLAAPLALAECLACQISSGLALDCTPALRGLALLDQVRQAAPDTPVWMPKPPICSIAAGALTKRHYGTGRPCAMRPTTVQPTTTWAGICWPQAVRRMPRRRWVRRCGSIRFLSA